VKNNIIDSPGDDQPKHDVAQEASIRKHKTEFYPRIKQQAQIIFFCP